MNRVEVLRRFFGDNRPLTVKELMTFKKEDPKGFDETVTLAAAEMGVSIDAEAKEIQH